MSIPGDGINALPTELLCNIFRLAINTQTSRRDRCRLSLVCRRWQEDVEGSAILWTDISTLDGHTYVRRALEKSKGAMIDLHCCPGRSATYMSLRSLLVEALPHIARWKSLEATAPARWSLEGALVLLTKAQAPRLESLVLEFPPASYPGADHSGFPSAITLFGGAPAPETLKHLRLTRVPVVFEPIALSGLVLLSLSQVDTISAIQLLEIFRRSPWLETVDLTECGGLRVDESQPSAMQLIELPKLDSLYFESLDLEGLNCILSNIRIPNRRSVFISDDVSRISAWSALFTSSIAHLLHTSVPPTEFPSSAIQVTGYHPEECVIEFRGIQLVLTVSGGDQIQEVLRWMADGLGPDAARRPVHLILEGTVMDPLRLAAVPPPLVVKHLSIFNLSDPSLRESLYLERVQSPDPTSSGWFLPQLESLSVGFETMEGQKQLIATLRDRYEGVTLAGETESRCPMNLQSIELRGQPRRRTEGLVEEIKDILGEEVDVFWVDC